MTAYAASFRAWGEAVYLYQVHAVPSALVFEHREEHPEGCVSDCLCKTVVALHPFHIQILHTDGAHLAVVRERMGYLVKAVFPLVGDMFLQTGYPDACLIAVCRAFLLPALTLLQHGKTVKAAFQVLRLPNVRPSEHTASDLIPKSMPNVVFRLTSDFGSSCMSVSTSTEAKYLPDGVMLMVTVLTVPLNLRCSTAGMSFAFGIEIVFLLKSTRQPWGF